MSYDRFVDERLLSSRDALNKFQIKMKILDFDENARDFSQRFGRRLLVKKTLLTIKHIWTWKNLKSECGRKDFFHLQTDGFRRVKSKMGIYWPVDIWICLQMRLHLTL